MSKKQIRINGLSESIDHWRKIVSCDAYSDGTNNCALCGLYHADDCVDCPISKHEEEPFCQNSPYPRFELYVKTTSYFSVSHKIAVCDAKSKELAMEMLEYLKMLLKKELYKPTYKVGDRLLHHGNSEYIIARCGHEEVILTSLDDGNRWDESLKVGDSNEITEEEFSKLHGGYSSEWKKKEI